VVFLLVECLPPGTHFWSDDSRDNLSGEVESDLLIGEREVAHIDTLHVLLQLLLQPLSTPVASVNALDPVNSCQLDPFHLFEPSPGEVPLHHAVQLNNDRVATV